MGLLSGSCPVFLIGHVIKDLKGAFAVLRQLLDAVISQKGQELLFGFSLSALGRCRQGVIKAQG